MENQVGFIYRDGNNNEYIIAPELLAYLPVSVEESSSGSYSGGEKKSIVLNKSQYQSLKNVLEKALETPSDHSEKRQMGSSVVVRKSEIESVVYLKYGSGSQRAVDGLLHEMLSSTPSE